MDETWVSDELEVHFRDLEVMFRFGRRRVFLSLAEVERLRDWLTCGLDLVALEGLLHGSHTVREF